MDGKRDRLLPFWATPTSWFLSGDAHKRAELEYYHESGYPLEYEILLHFGGTNLDFATLKYEHGFIGDDELKTVQLEELIANTLVDSQRDAYIIELTEHKYSTGSITEKEHDYQIATIRKDEGTMLGVKHKHGEIDDKTFTRKMADLRGDPWVFFEELSLEEGTVNIGSFKLDWNDKFIEKLRSEGFVAIKDEDCVDLWFTDFSKKVALEELKGSGVFDEEADYSYELKSKRVNDGKTSHR